jgi:hypothetical protein
MSRPSAESTVQGWEKSGSPRHRVAAAIARRIDSGDYKPHRELPSAGLREEFSVSPATVLHAKKLLMTDMPGTLYQESGRYLVLAGEGFLSRAQAGTGTGDAR